MSIIINNPSSNTVADGSITTTKLADSAVTPAKLSTPLANKNYFKNPTFSVIQGTASGTINASTSVPTASLGYPGETEWCIASATSSSTYNFNAQTLTITPSSTNLVYIIQRIEDVDASILNGKTITLSVEIGCVTGSVNVGVQILRPFTSANTHGTIASPTQTLLYDSPSSSTFISTSRRVHFSTTLPFSSDLGLEVRFIFTPNMTGTSFTFTRPKLEEGSTATAFISEDYAIELAKCQRYYEIVRFATGVSIGVGTTATTFSPPRANGVYLNWKVQKMLAPVASSSASSTFTVASASGTGSVALSADVNGVALTISASSGTTSSNWTCVPVNAGSNAFISGASHIP